MRQNRQDHRVVNAVDLLLPGVGEVCGSAEREEDPVRLRERLLNSSAIKQLLDKGGSVEDYDMCPEMPILIPGVGAQGGSLEESVMAGVDAQGERAVLAVSRSILYAGNDENYAAAAREEARLLRDRINQARSRAVV